MRAAVAIPACALAIGAAWTWAVPLGHASASADELRAQLVRERKQHRTEVRHLRRENRWLRNHPSPFTEGDTHLAARLVALVGGWPEQGALRVAWCESRHYPRAYNTTPIGNSHASGSWQVLYPSTWASTDIGRAFPGQQYAFNPYINAFAALRVWQRNHNTFREWADVCGRQGDAG